MDQKRDAELFYHKLFRSFTYFVDLCIGQSFDARQTLYKSSFKKREHKRRKLNTVVILNKFQVNLFGMHH